MVPFLTELDKAGKKSSILDAMQTLRFLHHVLGVFVEGNLFKHPWICGLVRRCEQERPPLKQSRVLTAMEVLCLEKLFIEAALHEFDRFALGACLFLLYACCRVSDVSYLDNMVLDLPSVCSLDNPGYLEASTMHHKTQRVRSKAGTPLLLIAPVRGLREKPWGIEFHNLCKKFHKGFLENKTAPLLNGVSGDSTWSADKISSAEVSRWLNSLLEMALGRKPEPGLTSHGLKATVLSWCMKSGVQDDVLKVLGHHSRPDKKTSECYGRDAMAAPLRVLTGVVRAVAQGKFYPDSSRSGQHAPAEAPANGPDKQAPEGAT